MENLTITKEAVLHAAEKCSTAKGVLQELFPEAFHRKSLWYSRDFVRMLSDALSSTKRIDFGLWRAMPGGDCDEKASNIGKLLVALYSGDLKPGGEVDANSRPQNS